MRFHFGRTAAAVSTIMMVMSAHAAMTPVWSQGFEVDTNGWVNNNYGTVSRVASGTGGITSSEGSFHALFNTGADPNPVTGPFTRFDGYRSTFPGTWVASVDVYLDTGWVAGSGFDYSVASNGSDGNHQRDFIFHVAKDTSTGKLLVGASNNSNFAPREDLENLNNREVTTSGWYTLQQVFRDVGGVLEVDLNLLDAASDTLLFTETRTSPLDTIPAEVGGNRYGWFTHITGIERGIAVDDSSLSINGVPEPGSLALVGLAIGGLALVRRRRVG